MLSPPLCTLQGWRWLTGRGSNLTPPQCPRGMSHQQHLPTPCHGQTVLCALGQSPAEIQQRTCRTLAEPTRSHSHDFPGIGHRDRGDSPTVKRSFSFPVPSLLYTFLIIHTYDDVYTTSRGADKSPSYVVMWKTPTVTARYTTEGKKPCRRCHHTWLLKELYQNYGRKELMSSEW